MPGTAKGSVERRNGNRRHGALAIIAAGTAESGFAALAVCSRWAEARRFGETRSPAAEAGGPGVPCSFALIRARGARGFAPPHSKDAPGQGGPPATPVPNSATDLERVQITV